MILEQRKDEDYDEVVEETLLDEVKNISRYYNPLRTKIINGYSHHAYEYKMCKP